MVNTVYRKIKELSAEEMKPRPPILIHTLCKELNINPESIKPVLTHLIDIKLIKYDEKDKHYIKLTLLGTTVKR